MIRQSGKTGLGSETGSLDLRFEFVSCNDDRTCRANVTANHEDKAVGKGGGKGNNCAIAFLKRCDFLFVFVIYPTCFAGACF